MKRSLTPDRQALADQLVAIIRDGGRLLTTTEVADRLGSLPGHRRTCAQPGCDHGHPTSYKAMSWQIIGLLNTLARRGEVIKWPALPGHNKVAWSVPTPAEERALSSMKEGHTP